MKQEAEEPLAENIEVVSPGILLQEARVSAQLTPADIAKKLNLKASLIEAIENNDFDEISSMTFARGYLKAYAKLVRVSESDVLEAFEHLNSVEQQQLDMQSFSHRASKKTVDNWLSIISFVVFMAIVVGVIVWWYQREEVTTQVIPPAEVTLVGNPLAAETAVEAVAAQAQDGDDSSAQQASDLSASTENFSPAGELLASEAELAANENETLSDTEPALIAIPQESQSSEAVAQLQTSTSDVAAQQDSALARQDVSTQDPQVEAPAANLTHLELRFSGNCWINVKDATGKRIAIGTKAEGHYTSVYGVAPFTIKLGKPDAVSIWLAGKPQQLPYYAKGSTASFELSLSN
jgi:cytoskeleton protein RodZ